MAEYLITYDRKTQKLEYAEGVNVFTKEDMLAFSTPTDGFGKSLLRIAKSLVELNKNVNLEIKVTTD